MCSCYKAVNGTVSSGNKKEQILWMGAPGFKKPFEYHRRVRLTGWAVRVRPCIIQKQPARQISGKRKNSLAVQSLVHNLYSAHEKPKSAAYAIKHLFFSQTKINPFLRWALSRNYLHLSCGAINHAPQQPPFTRLHSWSAYPIQQWRHWAGGRHPSSLSLWCAQGTGFIHPPLSIHCGVTQDAHAPPTLSNIVCCFFSSSHSGAKLPLASDTRFFSLFTHIALALFPRDLSGALLDTACPSHGGFALCS